MGESCRDSSERSLSIEPAKPMKKAPTLAEASPYKSVAEELETLRRTFRGICQRYTERVETEIGGLRDRVISAGTVAAGQEKTDALSRPSAGRQSVATQRKHAHATAQFHDLRDMLILLRTLQLKPAEGRRKDLKKVESVVEDLRLLAAKWG